MNIIKYILIVCTVGIALVSYVPVAVYAAETYVHGIINSPVTWDKKHSPYILDDDIEIQPAGTLTIEPGVTVTVACVSTAGISIPGGTLIVGSSTGRRVIMKGLVGIKSTHGVITMVNATITSREGITMNHSQNSTIQGTRFIQQIGWPNCPNGGR